ncbi:MAG: tetratricopeptide repeat protein [bacterium]|nr:tetratricopeptide repeat protein [bacterium]
MKIRDLPVLAILVCMIVGLASGTSYSQDTMKKDELFKKATRYFYQKKFSMAEILLQEEIKKNPENNLAYSYLGDIMLSQKRYDGALNLYKRAIDLDPAKSENYFRLGQIYYYKKLGGLSIENYQKSVEIDSTLKFAYYHIGLSYLMLERNKQKTIDNWETFLRLAPEDPQYESVRRVIELLKDPNFKIPPVGSDISIEEALLLGGSTLTKQKRNAKDKQAGHEEKKTNTKLEGIYVDDDL